MRPAGTALVSGLPAVSLQARISQRAKFRRPQQSAWTAEVVVSFPFFCSPDASVWRESPSVLHSDGNEPRKCVRARCFFSCPSAISKHIHDVNQCEVCPAYLEYQICTKNLLRCFSVFFIGLGTTDRPAKGGCGVAVLRLGLAGVGGGFRAWGKKADRRTGGRCRC